MSKSVTRVARATAALVLVLAAPALGDTTGSAMVEPGGGFVLLVLGLLGLVIAQVRATGVRPPA